MLCRQAHAFDGKAAGKVIKLMVYTERSEGRKGKGEGVPETMLEKSKLQ